MHLIRTLTLCILFCASVWADFEPEEVHGRYHEWLKAAHTHNLTQPGATHEFELFKKAKAAEMHPAYRVVKLLTEEMHKTGDERIKINARKAITGILTKGEYFGGFNTSKRANHREAAMAYWVINALAQESPRTLKDTVVGPGLDHTPEDHRQAIKVLVDFNELLAKRQLSADFQSQIRSKEAFEGDKANSALLKAIQSVQERWVLLVKPREDDLVPESLKPLYQKPYAFLIHTIKELNSRKCMPLEAALIAQREGRPLLASFIVTQTPLSAEKQKDIEDLYASYPEKVLLVDFNNLPSGDSFKLPKNVKHAALKSLTYIGNSFLDDFINRHHGITTLDLTPLENVTHIGDRFLSYCYGLTTLDLTPLENVTRIGDYFLSECKNLTTLKLPTLRNVTRIGNDFLWHCHSLTTLDLTPLSHLTEIGHSFLTRCRGLTTLDLTPLKNVTHIGNGFLARCRGLTTLDLTPLKNVTHIGEDFLWECSSLATINVSRGSYVDTYLQSIPELAPLIVYK